MERNFVWASAPGAVAVHDNHGSITTTIYALPPASADDESTVRRTLKIIQLLGKCLVRFGTAEQPAGSGFFVAPGLVVTSARLVPDGGGSPVIVRHGDGSYEADALCVHDELAVLRLVDPPDGHACAWLDFRVPEWGSELVVWGFPAAEARAPGPRTARTGFELHDRFLDLPGLAMSAGMSGGPVLSAASGGVCAVLTASGLAAPVGSLREIDADVYRQLRRGHDRFHRSDTRWSANADGLAPVGPNNITYDQQLRLYALLAALPPADDHVERYLRVFPLAKEREAVQRDYADTADDLQALAPAKRGELPHVVAYAADLVSDFAESLAAAKLRDWVFGAAGRFSLEHLASKRLTTTATPARDDDDHRTGPREVVRRFRGSASPRGYRLAALLSAAPLTAPVIAAVRSSLLPDAGQAELNEVLNSELVTPVRHGGSYEFVDGVRDILLGTLTAHETVTVLNVVGGYIEDELVRADPGEDVTPPHLTGLFTRVRAQAMHRATGTSGPDDLTSTFGQVCPVCRATLGVPLVGGRADRLMAVPSFQLEVGPPAETTPAWRLTAQGVTFPPATSLDLMFDAAEVEQVYLLCGEGHIFAKDMLVDEWKTVAVVGSPASGKTYLTTRMLHQNLDNPDRWELDDFDEHRIRRHQLSPLEEIVLSTRRKEYTETLDNRMPFAPTSVEVSWPVELLERQLPDAFDALKEIIRRTVVDGERRADMWGHGFRQPLVLRTSVAGRHVWTGISDPPGELFLPDRLNHHEAAQLLQHDAVLWVLDPAVAHGAAAFLDTAGFPADVMDGSLRPGTSIAEPTRVRAIRDRIQSQIGERLAVLDGSTSPSELYVAVSKCDLLHAALRNRRLTDLGKTNAVRHATAGYLSYVARWWDERWLGADPTVAAIIDHLQRTGTHLQLADALLNHYSDQHAFWTLVHDGAADRIDVPGSGLTIDVPSIGEHLDRFRQARTGRHLLLRDLVMSAVACGITSGLGQQNITHQLLRQHWRRLEFVLCSPLGALPSAEEDRIVPAHASDRFPDVGERSAGLTQLLLLAQSGSTRR